MKTVGKTLLVCRSFVQPLPIRRLWHRTVVGVLAVVVAIGFNLGAALAQHDDWEVDGAHERLAALMALVNEGHRAIDKTAFDVGALGFELAFEDADTILATVRERLVFEPYRGVLRGAEGALRSGGGNSFDQALLAAVLLSDAGHDVELLVAELDDAQARALLQGSGDARAGHAALTPEVEQVLRAFADATADRESAHDQLDQLLGTERVYDVEAVALTDQLTERLLDAVGSDVFDQSRTEATRELIEDVRRYAWVRYRMHGGESWTEAHPAWRVGDPPTGLDVLEVIEGSVAERDLHRVRIEVFAERRLGGALNVSALIEPWERPTALLGSDVLEIEFVPLDGAALAEAFEAPLDDPNLSFAIDPTMVESEMFTVTINGEPAPGALAFDTAGNMVPLVAAADPAAGVVRATGGGAAEATGALGGIGIGRSTPGTAEDAMALTGLWYEVSRVEPGGRTHTERRYIVDRLGPDQRAAARITELRPANHLAILTQLSLSVHTGYVSQPALLERALGRIRALTSVIGLYLDASNSGDLGDLDVLSAALAEADEAAPLAALEALFLADELARAPLPPGAVAFRFRPAVLVIERSFRPREDGTEAASTIMVDIHTDPQRVLRFGDDHHVEVMAAQAMRIGVWQTVTERAYVREAAGDALLASTASAVDGSLAANGNHLVLRNTADLNMLHDSVGSDDRAAMIRDLERGFVIVIASEPSQPTTWWRVDLVSGETLGLGWGGRGGALSDAILRHLSIHKGKYAAATGLYTMCMAVISGTRALHPDLDASLPWRTCTMPMLGVAAAKASVAAAHLYVMAVFLAALADALGFQDSPLQ